MEENSTKGKDMFRHAKWYIFGLIFAGGIVIGALAIPSAVEYTSKTEFCISCHEMKTTVYEEYKKTIHYNNPDGVRADCSDCHIPRSWGPTLIRKIMAAKDVYHHLAGTIDTPEKFEARRPEMAQRVWDSMKANNSQECRNCHQFGAMELKNQRLRAQKQHQNAMKDGSTCIDCHKGIAHKPIHEQTKKNEGAEDTFSISP
ncbi:MAG: NapC/NirT family cytochrome c [Gammaproteobacteria bacterium]